MSKHALRLILAPALTLLFALAGCGTGVVTGNGGKRDNGTSNGDGGGGEEPDLSTADLLGCTDNDGDGYGTGCWKGPDCNDSDPMVNPGALDYCDDGIDQNCDGTVDGTGCKCHIGATAACYEGKPGTAGVGNCRAGIRRCGTNNVWGACEKQVLPAAETCDTQDNDCDGVVDNGVKNVCGACGAVPAEACGDGFDNNCNGQMDEGCGTCDPQCQCGGGVCKCTPPTNQPCYSGPPGTAGVGTCKGGVHDCVNMGNNVWMWSACKNQVLPSAPMCDGLDHDCDGKKDDGSSCPCTEGAKRSCGSLVGECRQGTQTCSGGQWGTCSGEVKPQNETCDAKDNDCDGLVDEGVTNACGVCGATPKEVCGDGLDNDCNGKVDEEAANCMCGTKNQQACYRGPVGTRGVGTCKDGMQFCMRQEVGEQWGPCSGDVLPVAEVCGDGLDNDCNGKVDDSCGCQNGATRPCGSSIGECKPGTQTCTNNVWGTCTGETKPASETCDTKDNDCDGLVDEGVVNSCGKCPPAPCYTVDYTTPGNCSEQNRTCDGVVPDPNNQGAITLGESTNTLFPYIYISVTNKNQVALLNTDTGQKIWQRDTYGMNPSRTAVALDGTVWVGNRCLIGGQEYNYACSSMAHLDLNGNLICRADIPGWVRGVAIDGDNNVWAGTYNGQSVWKVDGKAVDLSQNPPRCKILGNLNVGVPVYGLAVDGRGYLWTSTVPTRKVDVKTIQMVASVAHSSAYGIAIDKANRVWFGGWGNGDMHRIDGDPPYSVLSTGVFGITAVTVHPDGTIWGSSYGGSPVGVVKLTLNQAGTAITNIQKFGDPNGFSNHGVAVDKNGKLWSPQVWQKGTVNRWDINGNREAAFPVDINQELYTYSDMTGIQLRTITQREGRWIQYFDSGYQKPIWDRAEWTANAPQGTAVSVQARSADTQAAFGAGGATQWCGPTGTSPFSFANCQFLNNHRWLQVEVKLSTQVDGVKPSVSNVKVYWSY